MSTLTSSAQLTRTPRRIATVLPLGLLGIALEMQVARSGELDPTFADHGRLTLPDSHQGFGLAIVQQPADGKLVVAGTLLDWAHSHSRAGVIRVDASGALDASFGDGGVVALALGGNAELNALVLQPDGKILVAGQSFFDRSPTNPDLLLARLRADGTLDPSFGESGLVILGIDGQQGISGLALLEDGRFVATGLASHRDGLGVAFARFESDGRLDPTFGMGPELGMTIVGAPHHAEKPVDLIRQSDGKLVACGTTTRQDLSGEPVMFAARVFADGSLDIGFGNNGFVRIGGADGRACVGDDADRIVLAGNDSASGDLMLVRLLTDGRVDATFGHAGTSIVTATPSLIPQHLIVQSDGWLAVTGSQGHDLMFARFDPETGAIDPSFGDRGVTIADFTRPVWPSYASGNGLIEQADGKLVAVGANRIGDGWDYDVLTPSIARVRRTGGHPGIVSFVVPSVHVSEGAGSVSLAVRRTGGATGDIMVDYETEPVHAHAPSDFTAARGTLVWTHGDTAAQSITVKINDDNQRESAEQFRVVLTSASAPLGNDIVHVTIQDAEPLPAPRLVSSSGGGALGIEWLAWLTGLGIVLARRRRRLDSPRSSAG